MAEEKSFVDEQADAIVARRFARFLKDNPDAVLMVGSEVWQHLKQYAAETVTHPLGGVEIHLNTMLEPDQIAAAEWPKLCPWESEVQETQNGSSCKAF